MVCKHLTYAEWRRVLPREINNPSEGGHSQPMYEILRWYWRLRGCMMRSSTSIYVPRQDIRVRKGKREAGNVGISATLHIHLEKPGW